MGWFIINLISIFDKDYNKIIDFFSMQPSKLLFSIFLIFIFFNSALAISEIFEDYLHNEKIKNVANKLLNTFAIILPLITIIIIFNLTI
jgi:succinate dehydrogenase / fumarate reductase, membrane anchor subunit